MKRIVLITLLLAGCASYQPDVPAAQQAKPHYADDLHACTTQMEDIQHRLQNGFGLAGMLYGYGHYSDAEVAESEQLSSFQGQHAYIDKCMKSKGYTVQ
jgi:hypothetical protein